MLVPMSAVEIALGCGSSAAAGIDSTIRLVKLLAPARPAVLLLPAVGLLLLLSAVWARFVGKTVDTFK
jgi:hypothetical protein